ncbi:hypothetical protein [Ammoniphilus sp. 3BR4]|uniref:hypothetical protein n=1 Tax=Ammoniphilus sp. 3BR4 TaxID=3158265 RepID=UPI0034674A24
MPMLTNGLYPILYNRKDGEREMNKNKKIVKKIKIRKSVGSCGKTHAKACEFICGGSPSDKNCKSSCISFLCRRELAGIKKKSKLKTPKGKKSKDVRVERMESQNRKKKDKKSKKNKSIGQRVKTKYVGRQTCI